MRKDTGYAILLFLLGTLLFTIFFFDVFYLFVIAFLLSILWYEKPFREQESKTPHTSKSKHSQIDKSLKQDGLSVSLSDNTQNISLCPNCHCMTYTINGKCGKCQASKSKERAIVDNLNNERVATLYDNSKSKCPSCKDGIICNGVHMCEDKSYIEVHDGTSDCTNNCGTEMEDGGEK